MSVEQAQANYDTILAQYLEVRARVEAGDSSPDTLAAAQHLYDQSLAAHAALVTAHQEPAVAESAVDDAAAEPVLADWAATPEPAGTAAPAESARTESASAESVLAESVAAEPVSAEPVFAAPVLAEPTSVEPASAQPSEFDLTEVAQPVPPGPAVGEAPAGAVLGRRSALRRFSPPPAEPEQPLRRDILGGAHSSARSGIGRERKVAGNLPDWDLLPPSEILQAVRR